MSKVLATVTDAADIALCFQYFRLGTQTTNLGSAPTMHYDYTTGRKSHIPQNVQPIQE
jgi:hypothetical protein